MDIYKYINITLVFIIYIILLYYANLFFNTKHNEIMNAINRKILIENFGESCLHEYNYENVDECKDNISPKCNNENDEVDVNKTREYCDKLHYYKDVLKTTNSSCDDIKNYKNSLNRLYCLNEKETIIDVLNTNLDENDNPDSATSSPSQTPSPTPSPTSTPTSTSTPTPTP